MRNWGTGARSSGLFFASIALVSIVASMPGLLGSWVGDDFHMVTSRYYGDWSGVWGVFTRHAGHYLGQADAQGATWPYRPVTMLTLLATHAVVAKPWLHHLVSWLLHMATGALLYVALLRQEPSSDRPSARPVALVLTALFLLHPVAVETYVWINGRSDLLAGLCLAGLAVVLLRRDMAPPLRAMLIVLLAFLGAGSKLPFVVGAVALWLGLTLRSRVTERRWWVGSPLFAGLGLYFVLRAVYTPFTGRIGAAESVFDDLSTWAEVPHLLAKSAAALLTLQAEAMQSLSWQLYQPLSLGEWVGGLALLAAAFGLVWRRDFGGLAYVVGFALAIAPGAVVSQAIWLGFDRYLYMPSILLLLCGAPYLVAAVEAQPRYRTVLGAAVAALVLVAALGTRSASLAYASHASYERALVTDHPDDPTMFFYLARMANESGQSALARETLAQMPAPPWPPALVMPAFALASELGDVRTRDLAIEYGLQARADDPFIRAHGMRWRYQRGELEEALALARSFDVEHPLCPEVRRQLELWMRDADVETKREIIQQAVSEIRCATDSR